MPLKGGMYRVHTTKSGKRVRLHWDNRGVVNEAVNIDDKRKRHTPAEFAVDRRRAKLRAISKVMAARGK